MNQSHSSRLPLEGVRILDLSRVLAGPWCTQILGDFGADVIKIEAKNVGDDTRTWGPPFLAQHAEEAGPSQESAYYLGCNRNKRSVAIDFTTPAGMALIRELASKADVLVENFRVGGLRKYGLDYDSIKSINPRLVYCSITGFGQNGPYAERGGYDFVAQGMGGLMSITGEKGGEPMKVGVAITDISTGMYATVSILLALRHAEQTGAGQYIDCSLLDTQMAVLANQAMNWLVGGIVPGRLGNAHPTVVPYRTFHTRDGSIVVAAANDAQYQALCRVLQRFDLEKDARYASNADRVRNRAVLEAELQTMIRQWSSRELSDALLEAKVPAGPINNIDQVFQDPFAEARQAVHYFTREDGVRIPSLAYPGKLSDTPASYRREPPRLGQHTFEVLAEWLNLSGGQLDELMSSEVIDDRGARRKQSKETERVSR